MAKLVAVVFLHCNAVQQRMAGFHCKVDAALHPAGLSDKPTDFVMDAELKALHVKSHLPVASVAG
jgi:hypothetical protein